MRRRNDPPGSGEKEEVVEDEEETRGATLQSPRPKKRSRGFEWHDPKRRYGPPPPTFDQRLNAEFDEAFTPSVQVDDAESGVQGAVERLRAELGRAPAQADSGRAERWRRAPERAAAWLQRKFDEVYGEEEEEEGRE